MAITRSRYNFRSRFFTMGFAYKPLGVWRQAVVPGQSLSIDVSVKFLSAMFTRNVISGGVVDLAFYYVPFRLLWDEWVAFISQGKESPTLMVPTVNTSFIPAMDSTGLHSVLNRRAYKLIYNQFYGSSRYGADTWYSDITLDRDLSEKRSRTLESFLARTFPSAEVNDPTYPVSAPISLNDFYQQMVRARSERFAQVSGDKYVDAMRRMGVDLDWRVQMAPELLQVSRKEVRPVVTEAQNDDELGLRRTRHEGTLRTDAAKRYRFAEHGVVFGILTYRPVFFRDNSSSRKLRDGLANRIEEFYLGDNVEDFEVWTSSDLGGAVTSEEFLKGPFAYLREGVHCTMFNDSALANSEVVPMMAGATGSAAGDPIELIFPDSQGASGLFYISDELVGGRQFSVYASGVTSGASPVPAMPQNLMAGS